MIKVENIDVWGFEHAIRGMRNPMNSWQKSDSYFLADDGDAYDILGNTRPWPDEMYVDMAVLGENEIDLMRRLYKAGTEHRKYLRQIFVSMDITAPLYWWKEFDTYKVGTVANSCSTMHKIHAKEFTLDDFSHEELTDSAINDCLEVTIKFLNVARNMYIEKEKKSKAAWWQMIQLLPSSYNQRRTVTMNYENVMSMINQRTGHKLDEWNTFVDILKSLPYVKEIRGESDG